jgi:hypothetical protein
MKDFAAKWVVPFYLEVLHANYVRQKSSDNLLFNQRVVAALAELDEPVVEQLLYLRDWPDEDDNMPGWRELLTGSWFCGLKGWQKFTDVIGQYLVESGTCYAGQGYCFALACFATEDSAAYLVKYLDTYLPQLELDYDQQWALPALMWIDEQRGTHHSHPFLEPGGLWEQYIAGRPSPYWEAEECKRNFWEAMKYCQAHFMSA